MIASDVTMPVATSGHYCGRSGAGSAEKCHQMTPQNISVATSRTLETFDRFSPDKLHNGTKQWEIV